MFFNLTGADTNDALEAIEREIAPILARHRSEIYLNEALFERIDGLEARADELGLSAEQARVLELRYHLAFIRNGAALRPRPRRGSPKSTSGWRRSALSSARTSSPTKKGYMLAGEPDLAGLPDFFWRSAARSAPTGAIRQYAVTLSRSSIEPFLQFSTRRDLREKAFRAWIARGENDGASDNRAIMAETVRLRAERARLLGFDSYAHFRLDDTMAKTPQAALDLLHKVWTPARAQACAKEEALQAIIAGEGGNFRLAPWDWRHYAGKKRKALFDLDEGEIKPYLQLDKIIEAAFYVAIRLFGLSFTERKDITLYHPDARAGA